MTHIASLAPTGAIVGLTIATVAFASLGDGGSAMVCAFMVSVAGVVSLMAAVAMGDRS